jgi:hypothetical protein
MPQLFRYTSGAVEHVLASLSGLQVHEDRMRENLDGTRGQVLAEALVMALAPALGRPGAQRIVRDLGEHSLAAGIGLREAGSCSRARLLLREDPSTRTILLLSGQWPVGTQAPHALDLHLLARSTPIREPKPFELLARLKGEWAAPHKPPEHPADARARRKTAMNQQPKLFQPIIVLYLTIAVWCFTMALGWLKW